MTTAATSPDQTEIPEFPLFDVDDVEVAMGAHKTHYFGGLGWDEAKRPCSLLSRQLPAENRAGMSLFSLGGTLDQYGFRPKPDLDSLQIYRALNALLKSWGVSHEQKAGTVALAIHHWCEPIPADEAKAA